MWHLLDPASLDSLIHLYGLWILFVLVMLESAGVPLPGETALIAAATYAGASHHLEIAHVVAVAALAAIFGDNIGYVVGRTAGLRLLRRCGPRLGLTEGRMLIGQYLFWRHGGKIVFVGRFIAFLRTFAALLAGANCMSWRRFVVMNGVGGMCWAAIFGTGAYFLGDRLRALSGPASATLAVLVVLAVVAGTLLFRRFEARLEARARATLR